MKTVGIKDHVFCDSIYMTGPEYKAVSGGQERSGGMDADCWTVYAFSSGDENILDSLVKFAKHRE